MYYRQNDYAKSIELFQQAITASENENLDFEPEPYYVYRLADVYVKMRQYDKALAALEQVADKDMDFYAKQAELYAAANNLPAAVKSTQRALMIQNNSVELWTKQAMYYRQDYDLVRANAAISKALSIDPENERAKLENARIKKGMGRQKEYQAVLNNVLKGFRGKYRELNG
jgi:tetratricopeptide (TPR) repeat protein